VYSWRKLFSLMFGPQKIGEKNEAGRFMKNRSRAQRTQNIYADFLRVESNQITFAVFLEAHCMYASTPITPEKNNKFEHMTIEIWRSDNFLFLASGGCEIFGKKNFIAPCPCPRGVPQQFDKVQKCNSVRFLKLFKWY